MIKNANLSFYLKYNCLVLNSFFHHLEQTIRVVRLMRPFSAFSILLCNCLHENACDDLFIVEYVKKW